MEKHLVTFGVAMAAAAVVVMLVGKGLLPEFLTGGLVIFNADGSQHSPTQQKAA